MRVIKKLREIASRPLTRIVVFGFSANGPFTGDPSLTLQRITKADDYEKVRQLHPELSRFGSTRIQRGDTFWTLWRSGDLVSSLWTSMLGAPVRLLEVGRTLRLSKSQCAFFDLQTPEEHRGHGFAVELIKRAAATLHPTLMLSWVVTSNASSVRANMKSGGVELGTYSMWSSSLSSISGRLAQLGAVGSVADEEAL